MRDLFWKHANKFSHKFFRKFTLPATVLLVDEKMVFGFSTWSFSLSASLMSTIGRRSLPVISNPPCSHKQIPFCASKFLNFECCNANNVDVVEAYLRWSWNGGAKSMVSITIVIRSKSSLWTTHFWLISSPNVEFPRKSDSTGNLGSINSPWICLSFVVIAWECLWLYFCYVLYHLSFHSHIMVPKGTLHTRSQNIVQ